MPWRFSTTGGHYAALGIGQAPYRLAGEPRDVIEDVHRLGGFGIAAHPDSPKAELRWREWVAPFDGLEWLNADSQWRDERRSTLARAVLTYWLRGPESIVRLFDRPELALVRWDAASAHRHVFAVGGLDAHARLPVGVDADRRDGWRSLNLPSYAAAFRTMSVVAALRTAPGLYRRIGRQRCACAPRRHSRRAHVHRDRRARRSGAHRVQRRRRVHARVDGG